MSLPLSLPAEAFSLISKKEFSKISIQCHPNLEEPVCNFLFEGGCLGLEIRERGTALLIEGYSPPGSEGNALQGRFNTLAADLEELFPEIPRPKCRVSSLPDRDWQEKWKKSLKPLRVGTDLVIEPSWWRGKKLLKPGAVVVTIDPKTAFGSGHHPSTRLALIALRERVKPGHRVLDYGCGSGLLAIYAAKLGASMVLGIDSDPEAVVCAEENVVQNRVEKIVRIRSHPRTVKRRYYDITVANIDIVTLTKLAPRIIGALREGGVVIFSGILEDQRSLMSKLWRQSGLRTLKILREGEWIAPVGRKVGG
jgi:ribosomal protein L11 methyltransferase